MYTSQALLCLFLILGLTLGGVVNIKAVEQYEKIKASKNLYLVEFYSEYCGSCQEFAPHWNQVVKDPELVKTIKFAKVNIDTPAGMAVAQAENALKDGIPHVRLLDGSESGFSGVMSAGAKGVMKSKQMIKTVKRLVKDLPQVKGHYVKPHQEL